MGGVWTEGLTRVRKCLRRLARRLNSVREFVGVLEDMIGGDGAEITSEKRTSGAGNKKRNR